LEESKRRIEDLENKQFGYVEAITDSKLEDEMEGE
jgi:hypothetical protein